MEEAGDPAEREVWRKRLFYYLDWLFQKDSNAGAEFAGLQVSAHCFKLLLALSCRGCCQQHYSRSSSKGLAA